ncbi:MAG: rRNA maturation RNase YbeY [Anaerovoracaceae bacterium]|jgi:probable rRNA maturation factor
MKIIFSEEIMPGQSVIDGMTKAGELCVKEENIDPERVEVSVTFVENGEIQQLNQIYRGKDSVTDVLSFPQFKDLKDINKEGPICLGDVVICTEQALLQADEFGHSPERELIYLFVHSMYHLLGYDHINEEDKKKMRGREESIMGQVGLER